MDAFMVLIIIIFLVGSLGYLAQTSGLCMVRGVNEWKAGKPEFLLAIILSGSFGWVAILMSYALNIPLSMQANAVNAWFAFGGILFGIGASFNQGCGVSTLSKLARGDLKMMFTVIGWFVGWCLLSHWQPQLNTKQLYLSHSLILGGLIFISVILLIWVSLGDKERKSLWFKMLGIGLIAGLIFLYEPKWTPSGLLHQVSHAIFSTDTSWPIVERYLLFFGLLLGMFLAAWRTKKFQLVKFSLNQSCSHIFAGTLMGIGASLALGGNDSQLLLALPALSPAGLLSTAGIVFGIWFGLRIKSSIK
jgi:hypothetical protein